MAGRGGDDTYFVDDAGDTINEGGSEGTDEVRTTLASYTLDYEVEILRGTSSTGQALTGNYAANTLLGGAGNDTLDGAGGADTLRGGRGNDVYIVDHPADASRRGPRPGHRRGPHRNGKPTFWAQTSRTCAGPASIRRWWATPSPT